MIGAQVGFPATPFEEGRSAVGRVREFGPVSSRHSIGHLRLFREAPKRCAPESNTCIVPVVATSFDA